MKIRYLLSMVLILSVAVFIALTAAVEQRQHERDLPTEILKKASQMAGESESEEHFYVITRGGDLKLFVSRSDTSRGIHTLLRISAPGPEGWHDEYRRYSRKPLRGASDDVPTFRYSQDSATAMFLEVIKLPLPEDQIFNEAYQSL